MRNNQLFMLATTWVDLFGIALSGRSKLKKLHIFPFKMHMFPYKKLLHIYIVVSKCTEMHREFMIPGVGEIKKPRMCTWNSYVL